jgi:hypothetical protein
MHRLYRTDIDSCNAIAQTGPAEFSRALSFVLATIQQRLETVPAIMADFEEHGSRSRYAFGSKAAGLDYLQANRGDLYRDAMACRYDDKALLALFLQVPGLGLVKAGFACQLFAGSVGCIDVHNIKLYDIPLAAIQYGYPKTAAVQTRKQQAYIDLCKGLGGSALLWSAWCDYLAAQRPGRWPAGRAVSEFHVHCLAGLQV